MPLFMDRHRVPEGTAPEDLAAAHELDLKVQDKYGVRYLTYWFDRGNGGVFCLVDAPSAEKAVASSPRGARSRSPRRSCPWNSKT